MQVRLRQPLTMELAREIFSTTSAAARVEEIRGFLLDTRDVVCQMGPVACYEIAYTGLEQCGFPRDCMWAILVSPSDGSHDFMETVARNAGYRCRLFNGELEAIAWLEKKRVGDSDLEHQGQGSEVDTQTGE